MFPILFVSPGGKKETIFEGFFFSQNWFCNSSVVTIPHAYDLHVARCPVVYENVLNDKLMLLAKYIYKKQLMATHQVFPTKLTYLALQRERQLSGFRALPLFSDDLTVERGLAQLQISL